MRTVVAGLVLALASCGIDNLQAPVSTVPAVSTPEAATSMPGSAIPTMTIPKSESCAFTSTTVEAPRTEGLIVFTTPCNGEDEIFVMNPDGTGVRRLTENNDFDGHPVLSLDGTRIAFTSSRYDDWEVFVIDSDGTDLLRLTDDDGKNGNPSWSPDGKRIVFGSNVSSRWSGVFVIDVDGTKLRQLTNSDRGGDDRYGQPEWSPVDDRIAFLGTRNDIGTLFVMGADGTDLYRVTESEDLIAQQHSEFQSLEWSPDGRLISFASTNDGDWELGKHGDYEIFVVNADGTEVHQLTDNDYADVEPSWSPDGKRIAFTSTRDGDYEIFVMNADGTEVRQLTDDDARDFEPLWSPNGERIAFQSDRGGAHWFVGWDIFVMNADGADVYPTGQVGYLEAWGG